MTTLLNMPGRILRIALLDDHDVVLAGYAARLEKESHFQVMGLYKTLPELFSGLQIAPVDIVVLDYSLGPKNTDGVNMITLMKRKFPQVKILIASSHDNPSTAALAMRAGAHGFVGKSQDISELINAIKTLALGRSYLSPLLAEYAHEALDIAQDKNASPKTLSDEKKLSPREKEVLRCFLEGMTVTEIALKFSRSPKTISTQKHHAYKKLGIRSDSDLYKMRHLVEGSFS